MTNTLDSVQNALDVYAMDYVSACLVCFLVCEYIDLLPREIGNIWTGKWVGVNTVYVICRYLPFFTGILALWDVTDTISCGVRTYVILWLSFAGLVVSEFCFILRTYALWGASRPVAITLGVMTVGMICGLVVDLLRLEPVVTAHSHLLSVSSLASGCIINGPTSTVMFGSHIVLAIDAVMASMVIWAKIKLYYDTNQLVKRLYHDAILYFLLNCLAAIATTVIYTKTPDLAVQVPSRIANLLTSAMACRMIIRLKERASCTSSSGHGSTSLRTIQFGPCPRSMGVDGCTYSR